ncbi:MAG: prolyl oligopeptidase [Planctomycetota bacterium]|nr:MAG: prolyl oligopeptidase [Planctomycetota bacterium]
MHWRWFVLLLWLPTRTWADEPLPALEQVTIYSPLDQAPQPVRYWLPPDENAVPLLVSLHSWSADVTQDHADWQREAVARKWAFLQPNFRGINDHPEACGSPLARQDVLDAVDWMIQQRAIDPRRIYLAGVSGGGHMTMLMVAYHPERFSAASAWVGISDLAEWHAFHNHEGTLGKYAQLMNQCCGGAPRQSATIDLEYYRRSPIHFLQYAAAMPIDLNAGVTDGKTGSVPIHQTLRAFNVLAAANHSPLVTELEMEELWADGRLKRPRAEDEAEDLSMDRNLYLRRQAGPSRVTIFDGGHEGLAHPACEWLSRQERATTPAPSIEAVPPR